MANAPIKSRWWSLILYPESAKEDWLEKLQGTGLPCCVSPLHDKDKFKGDEEHNDGDPKKPHYHILLKYPNTTTVGPIKEIASIIGASQIIEKVFCPTEMEGYHWHDSIDDPYKPQYNKEDEQYLNKFVSMYQYEETEYNNYVKAIRLIQANEITEFSYYVQLCLQRNDPDLLKLAVSNCQFITKYIDSCRYTDKERREKEYALKTIGLIRQDIEELQNEREVLAVFYDTMEEKCKQLTEENKYLKQKLLNDKGLIEEVENESSWNV